LRRRGGFVFREGASPPLITQYPIPGEGD